MRKPSPEDMIYAGLVLRLGLATEEEIGGLTRSKDHTNDSFIEIILRQGLITQEQHATIQEILTRTGGLPVFQRKAISGAAAAPVIDQLAVPTVLVKEVAGLEAGAALEVPEEAEPDPTRTAIPFSEAPTVITDQPPANIPLTPPTPRRAVAPAPRGTTHTGPAGAGSWTTLAGTLTREEISKVKESRRVFGDQMIGAQLGGYVLLDKLGRGGMGEVYLAKQLALNRYVALKVLPEKLARDRSFVARFVNEAQTLARINFPSVIQVFDVGVENDVLYFTMELVRGKSLAEIIKDGGTVPVEMAVNIIKQSCRALARVGREKIIHRDIKPGNIMLTEEGVVKVCDFGIATEKLDKTAITEIIGTPQYIAPEYLTGEECTALSDQYSLGVTFREMLTGAPQPRSRAAQAFGASPTALSDMDSSIPEELSRIVARMSQMDPKRRFGSFEDIFRALEDFELATGAIEAPSEFLADRLVQMREMGWENLRTQAGVLSLAAAGYTALALLLSKILERAGMSWMMGRLGGTGAILIFVAYAMILYVGLARKRFLPALGNLRQWVRTHYTIALIGYFLVMVHGGNFLGWGGIKKALAPIPGLRAGGWNDVPTVAFLSSFALFVVIISGLIGRFIFRELHKELALVRFGERKEFSAEERQSVTRLVIGTKIMGYWRVVHYPITLLMILLVLLHVISVMYFGGAFFGGK